MSTTKQDIMDLAETLIRTRGYKGFAFREIAEKVGIKSASVHYHFPTKGDLATAIMKRYRKRFEDSLTLIDDKNGSAAEQLTSFIKFYQHVVKHDKTLTLCMMMGQDKHELPVAISEELRALISSIIEWLTAICMKLNPSLTAARAKDSATYIHATLQGGIIGALATDNSRYFDRVARQLKRDLLAQ